MFARPSEGMHGIHVGFSNFGGEVAMRAFDHACFTVHSEVSIHVCDACIDILIREVLFYSGDVVLRLGVPLRDTACVRGIVQSDGLRGWGIIVEGARCEREYCEYCNHDLSVVHGVHHSRLDMLVFKHRFSSVRSEPSEPVLTKTSVVRGMFIMRAS